MKYTLISFISIPICLLFFSCNSMISHEREVSLKRGLYFQQRLIRELYCDLDKIKAPEDTEKKWKNFSVISAAWFGFDPDDSTRIITSALNSGARFILIPNMGMPWITEPLYINSNTTLIIEDGTELIAKRGAFQKGGATLLNLEDVENITIYGYGALIKMFKKDYRRAPYKKAQWRMAISIKGGRNIQIFGLTAESSGGDGIYLGSGKLGYNENIIIKDVTLRDHYRQGISVISAKNLIIENTEMSYTEGHSPAAGIDFEPNRPEELLLSCRLHNCIIHHNKGPGILICLKGQKKTTIPFDISIEDCIVTHNFIAIQLLGGKRGNGGHLLLHNNIVRGLFLVPSIETIHIINE